MGRINKDFLTVNPRKLRESSGSPILAKVWPDRKLFIGEIPGFPALLPVSQPSQGLTKPVF